MNVIEWLERNAGGFQALTEDERAAPMHFSLLWSFFEAQALGARASANAIDAWIRDLHARGKLDSGALRQSLGYFKRRYFQGGELTHQFHSLLLRHNDKPALVEDVIRGNSVDEVESAIALFIIIYRLRNNLLHGEKWAYSLQDQRDNFAAANQSIMAVIDMAQAP